METKPGYKTTEFWLTLVTTVASLAVALGYVTPDQSAQAQTAIGQIVGGVVALVGLVRYIAGRETAKVEAARAAARR